MAIKFKSTYWALKTQSHLTKKGCEEKGNLFPKGVPCCCCCCIFHPLYHKLFAFTFSFFSFVCEMFYWLCSHSLNQWEWHKGLVECRQRCCGTWLRCNISSCISMCISASQAFAASSTRWLISSKSVGAKWDKCLIFKRFPLFSFIRSIAVHQLSSWVSFLMF